MKRKFTLLAVCLTVGFGLFLGFTITDDSPNGSRTGSTEISSKTNPIAETYDNSAIKFTDNMDGANDTTALKSRGYWPFYRGTGPQGIAATWFQGTAIFTSFNGPATGYVAANFQAVTGLNNIDSWLILPKGGFNGGDTLSFYERSTVGTDFPDSMRVMWSATGDSIPEGNWVELGRFRNTDAGWTQRNFVAPSGTNGRFAIRYCVFGSGPSGNNGDFVGLDAITVHGPAAAGLTSLCFSRSGLGLIMPDNSPVGVRDTIKVTANAGNITDIAVVIESVTSTWIGDLIALLNHAGQTDTLLSRIGTGTFGNNSDDLTNVRFTDSATAPIAGIGNVISPSNGSWLAGGRTGVDSLRKHFVNQNISGNWELYMSDNAAGDANQTLHAWSICFYGATFTQIISSNSQTPDKYSLGQNYPNPFNPTTKIRFALPKAGLVSLKVYDMLGKEVQTLVNQQLNAGEFITDFDGANLSSGTYFYRLQVGDFVEIKKMVLLK